MIIHHHHPIGRSNIAFMIKHLSYALSKQSIQSLSELNVEKLQTNQIVDPDIIVHTLLDYRLVADLVIIYSYYDEQSLLDSKQMLEHCKQQNIAAVLVPIVLYPKFNLLSSIRKRATTIINQSAELLQTLELPEDNQEQLQSQLTNLAKLLKNLQAAKKAGKSIFSNLQQELIKLAPVNLSKQEQEQLVTPKQHLEPKSQFSNKEVLPTTAANTNPVTSESSEPAGINVSTPQQLQPAQQSQPDQPTDDFAYVLNLNCYPLFHPLGLAVNLLEVKPINLVLSAQKSADDNLKQLSAWLQTADRQNPQTLFELSLNLLALCTQSRHEKNLEACIDPHEVINYLLASELQSDPRLLLIKKINDLLYAEVLLQLGKRTQIVEKSLLALPAQLATPKQLGEKTYSRLLLIYYYLIKEHPFEPLAEQFEDQFKQISEEVGSIGRQILPAQTQARQKIQNISQALQD